jgi:hypothetical protein
VTGLVEFRVVKDALVSGCKESDSRGSPEAQVLFVGL